MTDVLVLLVVAAVVLFALVTVVRAVRIVPQQKKYIVERLGKYQKTLDPGLNLLVPFIETVRNRVDLREQVVSFPPQPVITSDNLVVSIDTVLYYVLTDAARVTYAIADYMQGIEQLTVTTLRNVIGSMDLEKTLTSREEINQQLRGVLDEATGKWGIRVTRVEIKAIEPPPSIRDSMEKQMRAERDRRAAILNAEGHKQSQILTAEGEKQAAILRAQGSREARILQADGEARAIETVFASIHNSNPDPKLLAYQYLQALPQIAQGSANKVWVVPAELSRALEGIGGALGRLQEQPAEPTRPAAPKAVADIAEVTRRAEEEAAKAVKEAESAVRDAETTLPSGGGARPAAPQSTDPSTVALPPSPPAPPDSVLGDVPAPERGAARPEDRPE